MHMKATIVGKRLADLVAIPPRVWFDAGTELRTRIVTRTRARGVDADGAPFTPYTEGYAKAKAKHGGMIGGGRVNLTGTKSGPKMLDTMVVKASATTNPRITIFFSLAEKAEVMNYHMKDGRVLRKFFALSDDDVDYAVDYIRKRMGART